MMLKGHLQNYARVVFGYGLLGLTCLLADIPTHHNTSFFPIHTLDDIQARHPFEKKPHTILIYIAADNDLNYFAWKNIKQMAQIGSNDYVNIIIQLSEVGASRPTQRYLIEKGRAILLNKEDVQAGKKLDSGSPQTLIDFCVESTQQFPADHYSLILWNHGSGILDPISAKIVHPSEFFTLNPNTLMFELNRNLEYIDVLERAGKDHHEHVQHGCCFDDSFNSFLSNQKMESALKSICAAIGQPFDIIGYDACLMAMAEVGLVLQPYARILVGSEEVELGAGWNYAKAFRGFLHGSMSPRKLAESIVNAYEEVYSITPDYTLSAIDLDTMPALGENMQEVARLLSECMKQQRDKNVRTIVKACSSKQYCTYFEEPSYKDLDHFYANIQRNIYKMRFIGATRTNLSEELHAAINQGRDLIKQAIIARVAGKDYYDKAAGIAVYLPERALHGSYALLHHKPIVAWRNFLTELLKNDGRTSAEECDDHCCIMQG